MSISRIAKYLKVGLEGQSICLIPGAVPMWSVSHAGPSRPSVPQVTAMGHTIHAMWNPEYIKMQKNAIRWLLRQS
jgi:hypothetical protein